MNSLCLFSFRTVLHALPHTLAVICVCFAAIGFPKPSFADGPADNDPESVRPVPPVGDSIDDAQRSELLRLLDELEPKIEAARQADAANAVFWYADVAVLPRAVRLALQQNTFYASRDVNIAKQHLQLANLRLAGAKLGLKGIELLKYQMEPKDGHWMLVGGFVSKIDATVQPYGLILPVGLQDQLAQPQRLDVWLHGRGERELELQFLSVRQNNKGYYSPANALTLHPYGRYSNAFKFAGETDVFEAIKHVESLLNVDQQRISIRGFSMGGAGCWQLAVHYPGYWMAATPGAGFSETREFLRVFQNEIFSMPGENESLLRWYDCPPWVNNLRNLPTIAYSGELDRQKQAADVMVAAALAEGIKLPHVIGPETEHKIHPDSASRITDQMDAWSTTARPLVAKTIDFTTYTLRYSEYDWLHIEGMQAHWQPTRVIASLDEHGQIDIKTTGATHLSLVFTAEQTASVPLSGTVRLDGTNFHLAPSTANEPWEAHFQFEDGTWEIFDRPDRRVRKRPGLQGPIDDAFSDSFVLVRPSRPCAHGTVQRWVASEMAHFKTEWSRQFRGQVREVSDLEIDDATIRDSNLIVFGDPTANRLLAKIIGQLPLQWTRDSLVFQGKEYPVETSAMVMIFPNPLNPERYIVLNSGFTYRQYAYLNNARQLPYLPDWAILDIQSGSDASMPGTLIDSGFFNENWK